jgi:large subunit ribosomal protein L31
MKADIHPKMNPVVFVDGDHEIVTISTMSSANTKTIDGVEHFVIPIDISSFTHPFFTGEQRIIDTAGQVERFMRRLETGVSQRETTERREEKRKAAELAAKRKRRGLTPLNLNKKAPKKAAPAADADSKDASA